MSNALIKLISTIPKVYSPESNPVLFALLSAIAENDDLVEATIAVAKNQLFIPTATGKNLNTLAASKGVKRPKNLGLSDSDFQNLIPNLSLKPKQIKKAFYDTADIFWGPLYSRANVTSRNVAPFDVNIGDVFSIKIDNATVQSVKVRTGDIALLGLATAQEIVNILSRINGITPSVVTNTVTGNTSINIRTNTPGSVGNVEIITSTMVSPSKVDFQIGRFNILNLSQRFVVYNIRPNELFIEIPAVIPVLRRTLKGSHHFHADATLESPVAPNNGIWQGSFLFNPTGSAGAVTISSQKCNTTQTLTEGHVYTGIAVDDTSTFKKSSGQLMFAYGTNLQEGPVVFRGIPNTNTILLDPAYVFKHNHASGTVINVVSQNRPYAPRINGQDLAVYLPSPSAGRQIVQTILRSLAAEGIVITFKVLAPKYRYLLDNPYLDVID